ncbi:MAG: DUF3618 domain-containing protein [Actinomycetes bacterium]|jgi:hypothetical protein|uniref:Unannotated protein n=1 Tax=freshwater metagenome TaxID=449393 RepID=A0A6J7DFE4_9ZZZZ|nr:DUF3618 domain-containing protein [Solirubrobacterales bacterium]MSW87739.1 DUF3618 domain-containing protein [Actinomycetota bacterium]
MSNGRSPEEIRAQIEAGRQELAVSIVKLRGEVVRFADWRGHLNEHRPEAAAAAAVAGFVIGGGIAAVGSALFGRRRRRRG